MPDKLPSQILADAAPDLYDALESLVCEVDEHVNQDRHGSWWVDLKPARAALAKARGETTDGK